MMVLEYKRVCGVLVHCGFEEEFLVREIDFWTPAGLVGNNKRFVSQRIRISCKRIIRKRRCRRIQTFFSRCSPDFPAVLTEDPGHGEDFSAETTPWPYPKQPPICILTLAPFINKTNPTQTFK